MLVNERQCLVYSLYTLKYAYIVLRNAQMKFLGSDLLESWRRIQKTLDLDKPLPFVQCYELSLIITKEELT